MKKRIFLDMDDAVFRIVILTEDWSEGDIELMSQYGEPEINMGGEIPYVYDGESRTKTLGDEFLRVLHGFPYSRGFDSRDYDSVAEAKALGLAWKQIVVDRLDAAVVELRRNQAVLPTEEVSQI